MKIATFTLLLSVVFASSALSEEMLDLINESEFFSLSSTSEDNEAADDQTLIKFNGASFPLLSTDKFSQWIYSPFSKPAAFKLEDVLSKYAVVFFKANDFDKHHELSNLATTPFVHDYVKAESVESMIYSNLVSENIRPRGMLAMAIARLDGHAAREVGKHYEQKFEKYEVKGYVISKLEQYPLIKKMVQELLDQGKLLVCVDKTHSDYKGIDTIWGMVRHGDFIVGENLLGKFYHEIYSSLNTE